jgi:hypothetical protein
MPLKLQANNVICLSYALYPIVKGTRVKAYYWWFQCDLKRYQRV